MRLFGSADLKRWETLSDFGPAGSTGGVWECPDCSRCPSRARRRRRGGSSRSTSTRGGRRGSGGQYFVGRFDGTRFVNEIQDLTALARLRQGLLRDHSFSTCRIGWAANLDRLDQQLAVRQPTSRRRRGAAQSLPRVLQLRRLPEGIRLVQAPVAEIDGLRTGPETAITGRATLPPSADIRFEVGRGAGQEAGLRLSNAAGEEITIGVRASARNCSSIAGGRARPPRTTRTRTPRGACQVAR